MSAAAQEAVATPAAVPIVITHYEKLKNDIAILKQEDAAKTFDYKADNKLARSHVFALRKAKGQVEAARVEAKKFALEYGRKVDSAAAELTAQLDACILPHQKALDQIEAEEAARKARHQLIIDRLVAVRQECRGKTSADIAAILAKAQAIVPTAGEEYAERIASERQATIDCLTALRDAAVTAEAEAAELAKLRAEAAAREAADAERRRQEAAEQARREAEEAARIRAEALAKEAAERAEREAQAAIAQAQRQAQEAIARAEQAERQAAQAQAEAKRAAEQAQIDADRRAAQERAQAEMLAKAEAERRRLAEEGAKRMQEQRDQMMIEITEDIAAAMRNDGGPAQIAEAIYEGRIRHIKAEWSAPC